MTLSKSTHTTTTRAPAAHPHRNIPFPPVERRFLVPPHSKHNVEPLPHVAASQPATLDLTRLISLQTKTRQTRARGGIRTRTTSTPAGNEDLGCRRIPSAGHPRPGPYILPRRPVSFVHVWYDSCSRLRFKFPDSPRPPVVQPTASHAQSSLIFACCRPVLCTRRPPPTLTPDPRPRGPKDFATRGTTRPLDNLPQATTHTRGGGAITQSEDLLYRAHRVPRQHQRRTTVAAT